MSNAHALEWDRYDYRIGSHFLSALINGDFTGLEDEEARALRQWERQQQENAGRSGWMPGHWDCHDADSEDFALCEVTGLFSSVVSVSLMVYRPKGE